MMLRLALTKISPAVHSAVERRALSTQTTQAVEKLRSIVEDYRQAK